MTEHQYRTIYGDSDDAAKFFREEELKYCGECDEHKTEDNFTGRVCNSCLEKREYLIDVEN